MESIIVGSIIVFGVWKNVGVFLGRGIQMGGILVEYESISWTYKIGDIEHPLAPYFWGVASTEIFLGLCIPRVWC